MALLLLLLLLMHPHPVATPTSALPSHPQRPFKYVPPLRAPDGTPAYERPPENFFDSSMASRLLPSNPPSRLYDTIARAHDHQFQVTPDMLDPSWNTPRPLVFDDRRRSLAQLRGNAPDYMGISPDLPGWRPRRSSYEDRRGAVGVIPSEVNTLIPYIPPIDTSLPPPSKEWLDAMAKKFLAEAHADFDHHATSDVTAESGLSPFPSDDSAFFEYDTDSTLDVPPPVVPRSLQPAHHAALIDSESSSRDNRFDSSSDSDTDTDSDTDMYDWTASHFSNSNSLVSPEARRWIIPRKRPSVVILNNTHVPRDASARSDPASSDDEHAGKRRRRGRKSKSSRRVAKKPKRHANDTPLRPGGKSIGIYHGLHSETTFSKRAQSLPPSAPPSSFGNGPSTSSHPPPSSITATAMQMKHVRITSPPCLGSPQVLPQPHSSTSPPRSPKLFPCRLNGCTQVCASAGDLQRHQQSLRHSTPSHSCLACGKSYTRPDALKRHLNSKASCKRVHVAKQPTNAVLDLEQTQTEANPEAV